jgi:mono/diheme cytochrome c family protein
MDSLYRVPILLATASNFEIEGDRALKATILGLGALTLGAIFAYASGSAAAGKAVYDQSCKTCHGATGVANPGVAKALKIPIPYLGSHDVQAMSDEDIKKVITDGVGKMRAVRSVTGKSADDVVAYIRTLKK